MPFYLIVSYNDICASRTFPSDFRGEKKADQLPGNSSGNCRGWAYEIVELIDAVRDCCDACFNCLSPSKKIGDHFNCGSHQICSHRANFSVNVFIHMSSLVTWLIYIRYDKKTDVKDN